MFFMSLWFQVDAMWVDWYQDYYQDKELRFSANTEKILAMMCFFGAIISMMKHKEELKNMQSLYKE
jgi:hypothetical protein